MMANFGNDSAISIASASSSGINSVIASSNSPVPLPLTEEIKNIFQNQDYKILKLANIRSLLSTLFTTRKTGFVAFA